MKLEYPDPEINEHAAKKYNLMSEHQQEAQGVELILCYGAI
jgi:hypothetical protein